MIYLTFKKIIIIYYYYLLFDFDKTNFLIYDVKYILLYI